MLESYRENLIKQLAFCKRCYGTTYSWNPDKRKYVMMKTKRDIKIYHTMSVLIALNVFCMVISHFYNGRCSENVFRILSLHIVGAAVASGVTRLIQNGKERSENIVRLLNEIEDLPETSKKYYRIILKNYMKREIIRMR
jgi:NADH:ubiquinone oxidoreductase subunit K